MSHHMMMQLVASAEAAVGAAAVAAADASGHQFQVNYPKSIRASTFYGVADRILIVAADVHPD